MAVTRKVLFRVVVAASLVLLASSTLRAQRQLSWDALDVTAHLGADGILDVVEQQTMVFSGDWNGGERTFNLRPRQRLDVIGVERIDPATNQRTALRGGGSLVDVDDYAMTDSRTLRWRSRKPSDPPFANTRMTYAIHYQLSGILLTDGESYTLDHDFAFPDRVGEIRRFSLRLTFDDAWKPLSDVRPSYSAGPLAPGRSFVLTIPLRFTGAGAPSANDTRRALEIVAAVSAIVGLLALSILWLLVREFGLGRFAPVQTEGIDADWISQHIVSQPAEVVGAAWDMSVDKDEVFALIARLVAERKLASSVGSGGKSLHLTLKVDRSKLEGYERKLVDGLFFGDRTTTSTDEVKSHYKKQGFDPASLIRDELLKRVAQVMPHGKPKRVWPLSVLLFLAAAGCVITEAIKAESSDPAPLVVGIGGLILGAFAQIPGYVFRQRIDWGLRALAWSLVPPVLVAGGAVWFLWNRVGTGAVEWSLWMIGALTATACWIVYSSINAMKSRNHRQAIAFRKTLAAGLWFFKRELEKEQPALSDDWFPWIAAFGLNDEADRWSVKHRSSTTDHDSSWSSTSGSSTSSRSSSSEPAWTGAGGGRSGGAGGGATWTAAMAGMAAGVAAPGSSSSGGGGSSGGGSSGGGGGGGW